MAKSTERRESLERKIKDLQARVARLQRPVTTRRQQQADKKFWADFERRWAEIDARSNAMREYYDSEREQRLRDNPEALRIAIEQERKRNAFLKSKGLKPDPSMIPTALRREAATNVRRTRVERPSTTVERS